MLVLPTRPSPENELYEDLGPGIDGRWRFRVRPEHLPYGVQEQIVAVQPAVAVRYYEALTQLYERTSATEHAVEHARARWMEAARGRPGGGGKSPDKQQLIATVRGLIQAGKVNPVTGFPSKMAVVKTGLCSLSTLKRRIREFGWANWEVGLGSEGIVPRLATRVIRGALPTLTASGRTRLGDELTAPRRRFHAPVPQ